MKENTNFLTININGIQEKWANHLRFARFYKAF